MQSVSFILVDFHWPIFYERLSDERLHRQYLFFIVQDDCLSIALWVYVVFNILWGLNYDRPDIASQMHLESRPYSNDELKNLLSAIVFRMNDLDSAARLKRPELNHKDRSFSGIRRQLTVLMLRMTMYFIITYPSVKPSLYSYLGNYLGFSGYYNPFTGEAQVNTTVPVFVQPFTTCHEIGHQLGYAKEEEANFAGYLLPNLPAIPLSGIRFIWIFIYMQRSELYARDSTSFIPYRESLKPAVRQDLRDLKAFYKKYENPFEPIIRRIYGDYLKANRQPQGINSYDEVVGLAIAYYKKFGREAF